MTSEAPSEYIADRLAPYLSEADLVFRGGCTGRRVAGTLALQDSVGGEEFGIATIQTDFNNALSALDRKDLLFAHSGVYQLVKQLPGWDEQTSGADQEIVAATAAHIGSLAMEHAIAPVDLVARWQNFAPKPAAPLESPYARLALYFRLLQEKPGRTLTQQQLTLDVGSTSSRVHRHISSMLRAQIVFPEGKAASEYGTFALNNSETEEPATSVYEILSCGDSWDKYRQEIARAAVGALKNARPDGLSVRSIWDHMLENPSTENVFRTLRPHKQRDQLNKVLRALVQGNVLTCVEPAQPKNETVGLTNAGRIVVSAYIDCLDQALAGDSAFRKQGTRLGRDMLDNSRKLGWLLSADFALGDVTVRQPRSARRPKARQLIQDSQALQLFTADLAAGLNTRACSTSKILNELGGLGSRRQGRRNVWSTS